MTFLTFRVIFLSAFIALGLGIITTRLAQRVGLVDVPGVQPHKTHITPVPLAGGISILLTILISGLLSEVLESYTIQIIVTASLVVFLFGLWDDVKNLSFQRKLVGQALASILLIFLGLQVRLFDTQWINWAITVVWLVGITNAYNFVDSMDGLATGLGGLAAAFFMLVTYDAGQVDLSLFSALLVGACVGSFYHNSLPAKFFLGDSGAQLLGFCLAALAIAYTPSGFLRVQSWFIPILLCGVPVFDTSLVVISRLRRRRPVYAANLDHTYHRLVALGMNANRAVVTMHIAAMLLGCLAFITLPLQPVLGNGLFLLVFVAGVAIIAYLDNKKWWK